MSNPKPKESPKLKNPIKEFEQVREILKNVELSDQLLIISNILFDIYPLARKADVVYQKIDLPILTNIEDHAYMRELYDFQENSFVYVILDRAHDLLRLGLNINKLKFG